MTKQDDDHDDDGVSFFESFDRVPSRVSFVADDMPSSSDSDDDPGDVRLSFASAVAPPSFRHLDLSEFGITEDNPPSPSPKSLDDYGVWMAGPMSVQDRRRKLLQGMGLTSSRNFPLDVRSRRIPPDIPLPSPSSKKPALPHSPPPPPPPPPSDAPSAVAAAILARTRSDSHLLNPSPSPAISALFRVPSGPPSRWHKWALKDGLAGGKPDPDEKGGILMIKCPSIKNPNTAKGFDKCLSISPIVMEVMRRDKTIDVDAEVAIAAAHRALSYKSPSTKAVSSSSGGGRSKKAASWLKNIKFVANSVTGFKPEKEKEKGKAKVKEKEKAKGMGKGKGKGKGKDAKEEDKMEKDTKKEEDMKEDTKEDDMSEEDIKEEDKKEKDTKEKEDKKDKDTKEKEDKKDKEANSSERLKVRHVGKSHKELSGLYMCQEILAHDGSIWTMKFSCDSRYLASAGEDRVVHVWQVIDTLSSSLRQQDQPPSPSKQPSLPDGGSSAQPPKKTTKKGKVSAVPDHIVIPDTIFSLNSEPFCSFDGHTDDILDLSWSKSQHLLSSSMDKTVRLWDIETKGCLKLFTHSDYVTCIQFNPIDENYFISGSLDAKVRIWSIPNRQVVDWNDLPEMVTTACYTPDGQGALVGTHKGNCRVYNTTDAKLSHDGQIELQTKKKKSGAKKVTGFQFAPDNHTEVLITSADSQIRVFDGTVISHKFRGFRNVNSQISASCTLDGKHIVCASEDSHVYVWKRDRSRTGTVGKGKVTTRSHEHFFCKDVLVAIPWPNGGSNCEPAPDLPSWSRSQDTVGSGEEPKKNTENASPPDEVHSLTHSASASGPGSASVSSSGGSSSSSLTSWGWGGGNNTSHLESANAWGMVVVTAGIEGKIRVYQNFGLPVKLNRPPLF